MVHSSAGALSCDPPRLRTVPFRAGDLAETSCGFHRRPLIASVEWDPGASFPGGAKGVRFRCRGLSRPSDLFLLFEKRSADHLPSVCLSLANGSADLFAVVPSKDWRHGALPADFISSSARVREMGRSRRSRYVYKICRRRFPPPGGRSSGIINPCATAAARRAGAGTLRTGYRGWSDVRSAPSGTDALNHTISKYERMCTEVLLDKVCPSGRPHHFLTKKLFRNEWIRSAMKLAGRTPRV